MARSQDDSRASRSNAGSRSLWPSASSSCSRIESDPACVQGPAMRAPQRRRVIDVLGPPGEHLRDDHVLGMQEWHGYTVDVHQPDSGEEFVFETRPGQHDVERHPRLAVHERHHACSIHEVGVADAQREAGGLHVADEGTRCIGRQSNRDIDIGAQARDTIGHHRLGAKDVPGSPRRQDPGQRPEQFTGGWLDGHVSSTRTVGRAPGDPRAGLQGSATGHRGEEPGAGARPRCADPRPRPAARSDRSNTGPSQRGPPPSLATPGRGSHV